jgi:hypothetical protein
MSTPTQAGRTARAHARRIRQRGTALMEALIVNMSLITLLAGVAYFGAVYTAKIRSDQYSRAYAFTYALHGCQSGDPAVSNESLGIESSDEAPSSTVDSADSAKKDLDQAGHGVPDTNTKLDSDPNYTNVFSQNSVGSVNARSTIPIGSFGALAIGSADATSTTRVQCNPVAPPDGNLIQAGLQTAKSFANW